MALPPQRETLPATTAPPRGPTLEKKGEKQQPQTPTWPLDLEGEAAAASAGCCATTSPLAAFELWLPMMRAEKGEQQQK